MALILVAMVAPNDAPGLINPKAVRSTRRTARAGGGVGAETLVKNMIF